MTKAAGHRKLREHGGRGGREKVEDRAEFNPLITGSQLLIPIEQAWFCFDKKHAQRMVQKAIELRAIKY